MPSAVTRGGDTSIGLVMALALLLACAPTPRDTATVENPGLRDELLARVARDQAVRDSFAAELRETGTITPAIFASMRTVDSINLAWLKPQIETAGFPTTAQVGREGALAAALLIQHADADPAFQAAVLPQLEAAYNAGVVQGQEFAMLTDRVAKAEGRPQRYGTQTTIADGRVIIDPIEDSAQVDTRRAAVGLPPLAEYQQVLDSMYAKRPAP